jgi:hypothetical protein
MAVTLFIFFGLPAVIYFPCGFFINGVVWVGNQQRSARP